MKRRIFHQIGTRFTRALSSFGQPSASGGRLGRIGLMPIAVPLLNPKGKGRSELNLFKFRYENLILILFLCAGLLLGWSVKAQAANLLTDPSIESWTDDAPNSPWFEEIAALGFRSTDKRTGTYAAELRRTETTERYFRQLGVTMVAGTRYYISVYAKGKGDIRIGIRYGSATTTNYCDWQSIDTTSWIEITHDYLGVTNWAGSDGGIVIQVKNTIAGSNHITIDDAWFSGTAPQSVTVNNVTDGVNVITVLDGTKYLRDADATVNMTLAVAPSAAPVLWFDVGADPTDGSPSRSVTATGSGASWSAVIPASDDEIVDGALVRFLVKVDGINYYLTGTTPWKYNIDGVGPTCPSGLAVGTVTITTIPLSWTAIADPGGSGFGTYRFYYESAVPPNTPSDPTPSSSKWDKNDDSALGTRTTTGTTITGLTPARNYKISICALDGVGNMSSLSSPPVSATTETPTAPVVVFTTGAPPTQKTNGSGTVDISMGVYDQDQNNCKVRVLYAGPSDTDPGTYTGDPTLLTDPSTITVTPGFEPKPTINNGQTYQIGGTGDPIKTTGPATNTVTFDWNSKTDLSTGDGTYWLKLVVADQWDEPGGSATKSVIIDNVTPSGLASFKASSATSTSITFSWTACTSESHFSHYEIWYDDEPGITRVPGETEWDDDNAPNLATMSTTTTTIDTGLASGNIYYFKIWAVDQAGNEQTIGEIRVGLANVQESESKASSSKMTWMPFTPSAATFYRYRIWYGINRADVENKTSPATYWDDSNDVDLKYRATTSTIITGLSPGTTYYMQLWGVYNPEVSTPVVTITTPSAAKEEAESTAEAWGCFIATAAYSSSTKPHPIPPRQVGGYGAGEMIRTSGMRNDTQNYTNYRSFTPLDGEAYLTGPDNPVTILRNFRNECLLTNPLGRAFVSTYYKVSPPIADFIRDKEPLKAIVRFYLRPVVWLAKKIAR